ncbi:MAG: hypothetical protein AAB473_04455 [Patescibacteria group bacterium]
MSVDALLERVPTAAPRSSSIVTRLANVCQRAGIEQVWMLATLPRVQLCRLKNCMNGTVNFAEAALKPAGCRLDMFPQLREIIEAVVVQACKTPDLKWLTPFEVLIALAGTGDWAKEPAIIAALAEHGLRPGMPLEQLFVYDPSLATPIEPKELTVAEEVAAFMALTVADVLPHELPSANLIPTMTMGELSLYLASVTDEMQETKVRRGLLYHAANSRLKEETMRALCIPPGVFSI